MFSNGRPAKRGCACTNLGYDKLQAYNSEHIIIRKRSSDGNTVLKTAMMGLKVNQTPLLGPQEKYRERLVATKKTMTGTPKWGEELQDSTETIHDGDGDGSTFSGSGHSDDDSGGDDDGDDDDSNSNGYNADVKVG
jgi:hypothetical protein